jgi:hypothetical protein
MSEELIMEKQMQGERGRKELRLFCSWLRSLIGKYDVS